jgi:LysR family transcriptional regulator, transcriptional activator of the cysJI operon
MDFDFDLFRLKAFAAVVDEGGFTKAAARVGLSQPAVTQSVRVLESQAGEPLLERLSRGVRLTEAGRTVYDAAKRIISIAEEAETALEDRRSGESGHAVIGAGATISIFVLPEIIGSFRKSHPAIGLSVLTGKTTQIRDLVLEGEADIGIVTSPLKHAELEVLPLYEDQMVFVTARNSKLGERPSFSDLEGEPLILFSKGSGFRSFLDELFQTHGLSPSIAMESDSMEAIKRMAVVGLGSAIIPKVVAEPELSQGLLRSISIRDLPPMRRLTQVIYKRERRASLAASRFLDHLRASFPRVEASAARREGQKRKAPAR